MSIYAQTIPQMQKMLNNLSQWLKEAEEYAESRNFHPDNYLGARLQLDQFELLRQVQAACDNAKNYAARASGAEAPVHEDNEKTFEELKARVAKALAYLDTVSESDFEGAEERVVRLPFLPKNLGATVPSYTNEFALPNFYFHITMVYAILRHSGVKLGKRSFIGGMEFVEVEPAE